MSATYSENDTDDIAAVLIGRRIVAAEEGTFDYPGRSRWADPAEGRLVLDDGTHLYLKGNEGGCSCGAGDYSLEKVAKVDNIITSVRIEADPDEEYREADGVYRIFVVADAVEINVAEFTGSDGNGYYGTGFSIAVVPAAAT